MTAQRHHVYPNLYKDSVALMAISAALTNVAGIEAASVVMATDSNRENLRNAGLADDGAARPNDLLVAVRGDEAACEQALELADRLLAEQPSAAGSSGVLQEQPPTSVHTAVTRDPSVSLALVSVPGPYAAAEALKALALGLDVMLFSDNVPVEHEVEIKRYAAAHKRLVMGPDCGTALVNGIPLGFANAVRRGRIGVVGASGTGMQEITCRVHQHGEGVSQALGTGGHDLSADVGDISTLHALQLLDEDEATDVVVLVSKPRRPRSPRPSWTGSAGSPRPWSSSSSAPTPRSPPAVASIPRRRSPTRLTSPSACSAARRRGPARAPCPRPSRLACATRRPG